MRSWSCHSFFWLKVKESYFWCLSWRMSKCYKAALQVGKGEGIHRIMGRDFHTKNLIWESLCVPLSKGWMVPLSECLSLNLYIYSTVLCQQILFYFYYCHCYSILYSQILWFCLTILCSFKILDWTCSIIVSDSTFIQSLMLLLHHVVTGWSQ